MGVREADPLRGKEQINTWLLRARCEDRLGPQEPEARAGGRIRDPPDPHISLGVSALLGRFVAAQVPLDGHSL